jgi:16S rRNA processing protein RimM
VRIEILLDDPRVFEQGRKIRLIRGGGRPEQTLEIEFVRHQHGRVVMKLRGVDSIAEAEALAGCEVGLPENELPPPGEGSFYSFHIKGCRVDALNGDELGTVSDVLGIESGGGTPILKVDGKYGEILIPFASAYLKTMDLEHRHIEVDLPDGLRDLNK